MKLTLEQFKSYILSEARRQNKILQLNEEKNTIQETIKLIKEDANLTLEILNDPTKLKEYRQDLQKRASGWAQQEILSEKKLSKNNPWAICTASVGREDKKKYEDCVMDVKKSHDIKEENSSPKVELKKFTFKAKHDTGSKKISIMADSEEKARELICKSEKCPSHALTLISENEEGNWSEHLKKGRFTTWAKHNGFPEGASKSAAEKALKSDDASVRGMASFYLNTIKP